MNNKLEISYLLKNPRLEEFVKKADFLSGLSPDEKKKTKSFLSDSGKITDDFAKLTDTLCNTWMDVGIGRNPDSEIISAYENFIIRMKAQVSESRKGFPVFINEILSYHDAEFDQIWLKIKRSTDLLTQSMNWANIFGRFLEMQIQLLLLITEKIEKS